MKLFSKYSSPQILQIQQIERCSLADIDDMTQDPSLLETKPVEDLVSLISNKNFGSLVNSLERIVVHDKMMSDEKSNSSFSNDQSGTDQSVVSFRDLEKTLPRTVVCVTALRYTHHLHRRARPLPIPPFPPTNPTSPTYPHHRLKYSITLPNKQVIDITEHKKVKTRRGSSFLDVKQQKLYVDSMLVKQGLFHGSSGVCEELRR